jgi:hypothetical protein
MKPLRQRMTEDMTVRNLTTAIYTHVSRSTVCAPPSPLESPANLPELPALP